MLDLSSAWNGVAVSSSPFFRLSLRDEDVATPMPFVQGRQTRDPANDKLLMPQGW